jgi:hypothetical protein
MERVQYGIADIGFRYAVLEGGFIELNNRKHSWHFLRFVPLMF